MRGSLTCAFLLSSLVATAWGQSKQTDVLALIKSLKHKDKEVRLEAVEAIGKSRKAVNRAVPELIRSAKDPDEFVRAAAIRALGYSRGHTMAVLPVLIEALEGKSFSRTEAIYALGKFGSNAADATPAVTRAFENADLIERGHILKTLAKIGPKSAPFFQNLLKDKKDYYRSDAIYALAETGADAKEFVPILVDILKHSDEERTREACAYALGQIGPAAKSSVPVLRKLINGPNRTLAARAIVALGGIGPDAKEATPDLLQALKDERKAVDALAALECIDPGQEKAIRLALAERVQALGKQLKDGDRSSLASRTARELGELGRYARGAVGALVSALKSGSTARFDIVDALAQIDPGNEDAVKALREALRTKEKENCFQAGFTIRFHYGPRAKSCLPELVAALKHEDEVVRRTAAEAIAAIGPDAKVAVPALLLALKDTQEVRLAAIQALASIGDKSVVPVLRELRKKFEKEGVPLLDGALMALDPAGADKKASERLVSMYLDFLDQTDADLLVQFLAYMELAQMGTRATPAVPVLEDTLKDGDARFRTVAAGTLVAIQPGHKAAVRILTARIPELVRGVRPAPKSLSEGRVFAIQVLGCLGPKASEAIPALEQAARDPNQSVHKAAVLALKKIKVAK